MIFHKFISKQKNKSLARFCTVGFNNINKVVQVSKDEFIQKFGTTYEPRKSANGKGFALKIENDKVFGTIQ